MADSLSIALLDLLRKADTAERTDFVRQGVERLAQEIIEVEVEQEIGAGRHERTASRSKSRNGNRPRAWDTTAGTYSVRTRLDPLCLVGVGSTGHPGLR